MNDELGELRRALSASEAMLRPGGRLVIVSFHSLEDGIVKGYLYERSGRRPRGSRHLPDVAAAEDASAPAFKLERKKPVLPGESEIAANPRSRSAKLRVAIRAADEGGRA